MKQSSRVHNIFKNTSTTFLTQLIQILLAFVVRKAFINTLGIEYLGYNSVFSNILQMLNLADLGIGVAITSFLYKPLTENDKNRVNALMVIYKRIYMVIGTIVLFIGIIVSFFLNHLIPDSNINDLYLRVLFFVNLIGTVSTYFLAYKRTLIIADQKSYVVNVYDTIVSIIITLFQLLTLYLYPNYLAYLTLGISKNVISNIFLSRKSDKIYGKVTNADRQIVKEYKSHIIKYVRDVFISRIGAVIYYGTDNVIISTIKGSLLTGFLSNYTMITGYLSTITGQVLASVQATFGNYINSDKTVVEQRRMTDNYFFANFMVGDFCMICFMLLSQDFISVYFGKKLLLSFSTAIWLSINLMLTMLIQLPSQVFTIYKLFRYDRPIIIVSALLNIIISVVLVKQIGIDGALIGTFVTSLIYLFSRFYIISKKIYGVPYLYYIKKILVLFIACALCSLITYYSTRGIVVTGWLSFIVKAVLVGFTAFSSSCALLCWKNEFHFLTNKLVPLKIRGFVKPMSIVVVAIICIIGSFLIGGEKFGVADINSSNKSLERSDFYVQEHDYGQKVFHFSIDDTIDAFSDISNNRYDSIFQNEMFAWLRDLHDEYGVKTSCFVYLEQADFSLSGCTDRYKYEFEENSDWLRFGFHTKNRDTTYGSGHELSYDYNQWVTEMERIVGSTSIDNVVRLQSYQGNYDNIKSVVLYAEQPIIGLLTADDDRKQYYFSGDVNKFIYSHDTYNDEEMGLMLISTDLRVENVDDVIKKTKEFNTASWNNQLGMLEIFTHEWALSMEVKDKVDIFCHWAVDNGYTFEFPEDRIGK